MDRAPSPLTPGEWLDLAIEFEATTWTLAPGHRVRLSIAGSDWPNAWPPPGPVTLSVELSSIVLELPVVDGAPASAHEFAPGVGPSDDDGVGVTWRIEHDVLGRETRVVTRYGSTYDGIHGAVVTDDYRGQLGVSTVDPALAWARGSARFEIRWPEAAVTSEAALSMRSDHERFEAEITLTVTADGQPFAAAELDVDRPAATPLLKRPMGAAATGSGDVSLRYTGARADRSEGFRCGGRAALPPVRSPFDGGFQRGKVSFPL